MTRIFSWTLCAAAAFLSGVAEAQMSDTALASTTAASISVEVPSVEVPGASSHGEPLRLTSAQRELAWELTRVNMNESGREADLATIWQVVQQHGRTPQQQVAWLRRHSPCATGVLPQHVAMRRPGNCRWVRHLYPNQVSPPQGYPDEWLGAWPATRERLRRNMRWAAEFVSGARVLIVCAEPPTTWDGRRWETQVRARGFRILDCKGTRNLGVRPARERMDTVDERETPRAEVARVDPTS